MPVKREVFTAEERAAMRERVAESRRKPADEAEVVRKIAEMAEPDRSMASRIHEITKSLGLKPTLWYGMPAYARDGRVVCFFQSAGKFRTRYSTLGFTDKAMLDDGAMWPVAFALKELTPAEEARITALVRKAVG